MILQKIVSVVALSATLLQAGANVAVPDKNIDGTLFLINRQHMITESYIPDVRKVIVSGMSQAMREDAAAALEEMFAAAKAEGIYLSSVSGYRSYSKQKTIHARKVKTSGQEVADLYSALPGASEHQLGMAMDLAQRNSSQLNSGFGNTKAGQWVDANCYKYGFIVRYLEGEEAITGYAFEPWHVRYVGKDYAKAIFESGQPLETYLSAHRLAVFEFLIK